MKLGLMRYVRPFHRIGTQSDEAPVRLLATGDIALGNRVQKSVEDRGVEALLGQIKPLFESADLRIANLEAALTNQSERQVLHGAALRASPKMIEALRYLDVDVVSLANNHCLDYGQRALSECIELLTREKIKYTGVVCPELQQQSITCNVSGIELSFLSYCDEYPVRLATDLCPAAFELQKASAEIQRLKARNRAVIVQLHWGYEFSLYPLYSHVRWARELVDAGADVVLCHHAHVPMGVELWRGKLIAYGLGNFIFDTGGYQESAHPWTNRGLVLAIDIGPQGFIGADLIPVTICKDGSVYVLEKVERAEFLGAMTVLSRRLAQTSFLLQNERRRTLYECANFLRHFVTLEDPKHVFDRLWFLGSPRQRAMLNDLESLNCRAASQIANILSGLSLIVASESSAWNAFTSAKNELTMLLLELDTQLQIPTELPGKTP